MTPHGALIAMRLSSVRNHLLNLKKDSATKILVVIFGLAMIVTIGLLVSYKCFEFSERFIFGSHLNAQLISLLFFTLMVLVALSTVIISYTTFFIAKETAFLFQHPIPPRTILFLKVFEAVSFSAWASMFLCCPVLISFGVLRDAPWTYYAESILILATFLVFSGLVGSAISILFAPLLRRLSPRRVMFLGLGVLGVLSWIFLDSFEFWNLDGENNLLVLDRFMSGLRAMRSPFSPSRWASASILNAVSGQHSEVLYNWALLLSNTLILFPLHSLYGKRLFGREWVRHRTSIQHSVRSPRLKNLSATPRHPLTALIKKDVLTFVRNPAQISQSLLFALLMVIYSFSLIHIPTYVTNDRIRLFIHFANLAAACMILSSFTSRFLFPLLSLEGPAFWILGLAPMPRSLLIKQKLTFGLVIAMSLGLMTVVLSNIILKSPSELFASAVFTMAAAAFCVTSLATGLGAAYPNFEEDNPARIASGIGGTLNFFASACSVAMIVVIVAVPHFFYSDVTLVPRWLTFTSHFGAFVFTLCVSGIALSAGHRSLARREF